MSSGSTKRRTAVVTTAVSAAAAIVLSVTSPAKAAPGCADVHQGTPAADTLVGSSASDCVLARAGADVVYARSGNDIVTAGPGNDKVWVRDGMRDIVGCGKGHDKAYVDRLDVALHCERLVRRPSKRRTSPRFLRTLDVSVSGSGTGTVSGPGIECPGDCSERYTRGTIVTLIAAGADGSSFSGWNGACSGTGGCSITIDANKSVGATFDTAGSPPPPPPPSDASRWYSDASPFNTAIPASPSVRSNSRQIVQRMVNWGPMQDNYAGASGTSEDWSHPIYFAKTSDPLYRIHQSGWANQDIEGLSIHIPSGAKPAGGADASIAIVQPDGWEYDFWSASISGGTISAGFGKRGLWTGDGLGTSSYPYRGGITEAGFSLGLGVIRADEMNAGVINHALFMHVRCHAGDVWPADSKASDSCSDPATAPAMGHHFFLDMTNAEIDDLSVAGWKKIILRAMAHYGLYVGDDGGSSWGLQIESGTSYRSFGQPDPWVAYAQSVGINGVYDSSIGRTVYHFNLSNAVDWGSKLKVLTR